MGRDRREVGPGEVLRRGVVVELVRERRHPRDVHRSTCSAGQAKFASATRVLRATRSGAGYAPSGYSAAIAEALAAETPSTEAITLSYVAASSARAPARTAAAHGEAEPGDEDPLLVVVDAVQDRHMGEPPGRQRRPDRLGKHLAVDDARDRGAREGADEGGGRHVRRQAAVWSGQPTWSANVWPDASASASDIWFSANAPLSTIARWKSPREPGETRWASTETPPADSPAIVTLCGSPPNRAMLCWTQRSAACWSIRP